LAGETILIIDDNPDVRILLGERVLPSYGYQTLTATDGQEGLWQIRTQKPNLILLDLRLPDMTGLDLLHILSSEGYDTPVILITAYGSELIAAQALRLGVRDYIIKPFTLDEIVESVERALTEYRLRRERNALTDHLHFYTEILNLLAGIGTEIFRYEDVNLQTRRLLEIAVTASQASWGRLWRYPSDEREPEVLAILDQEGYYPEQEGEPPQVKEVVTSGEPQQWKSGEEANEIGLAIPVFQAGRVVAVLETYFRQEELLPDDPSHSTLRILADWLGIIVERSHFHRKNAELVRQSQVLGKLSKDLLIIVDSEDRIVATTSAIKEMFNQTTEQVIGKTLQNWIQQIDTPCQEDLIQWYVRQADGEQSIERYPFLFNGPAGDSRQAEIQLLLQRGEDGILHRYLLFRETTVTQRLGQEVRYLRQVLGETERSAQQGLFLTDLKGTTLAANSVALDLLQLPLDELLGQPLWELFTTTEGQNPLPEEIARTYREGYGYTEAHASAPTKGAETLAITTLLLVSDEEDPHAIAALARPVHVFTEGPGEEKSTDESDLLGSPRVDSNSRP
jgi:two-component system NtrC family sensor kinase